MEMLLLYKSLVSLMELGVFLKWLWNTASKVYPSMIHYLKQLPSSTLNREQMLIPCMQNSLWTGMLYVCFISFYFPNILDDCYSQIHLDLVTVCHTPHLLSWPNWEKSSLTTIYWEIKIFLHMCGMMLALNLVKKVEMFIIKWTHCGTIYQHSSLEMATRVKLCRIFILFIYFFTE